MRDDASGLTGPIEDESEGRGQLHRCVKKFVKPFWKGRLFINELYSPPTTALDPVPSVRPSRMVIMVNHS